MANHKSIDNTFKVLRKLPLEVSFEQVVVWVNEAQKGDYKSGKWWGLL